MPAPGGREMRSLTVSWKPEKMKGESEKGDLSPCIFRTERVYFSY